MSGAYTIGIDLGGTNIKAGIFDESMKRTHRFSIDTEADGGFQHVFGRILGLIEEMLQTAQLSRGDIRAIGFGVPGPMSHRDGLIHSAPNLPGWINIPLRKLLQDETAISVVLENDANAAAYGEYVAGAASGIDDMVMLTLGTGIGGGIVIGGQLVRGHFDNAGEIGHTIIEVGGRECGCGQRGCLERYASASSIAQRVVEAIEGGEHSSLASRVRAGREIDSQDVQDAMQSGDSLSARIWDDACRCLALACVNLQHILNPQCIVLSGGLIGAKDALLLPVREHFARLSWTAAPDRPAISLAALEGDAGIVGAAALARIDHP